MQQERSKIEVSITSFINGQWQLNLLDASVIEELYFIEDMFAYNITGKIIFNDTQGLLDTGGLISDADVWVSYGDGATNNSDGPVQQSLVNFKIQKISKINPTKSAKFKDISNSNILELILVDPHYNKMVSQKYSRSWSKTKVTTIIEDILTNMTGWDTLMIDPLVAQGSNEIDFYMPYWTPLQALNWLLERLTIGDEYGFCCYNSIDDPGGGWGSLIKLDCLENLLTQDTLLKDPGEGIFKLESGSSIDYNRVLSYQMSGVDTFNNKQLRGGHVMGYDFERKKLIDEKFQYSGTSKSGDINTLADKVTTLGKWTLLKGTSDVVDSSLWTKDTESNVTIVGESDEKNIKSITHNNWIKTYCSQNILYITVKGHESRRAGKMIEIQWPPTNSTLNLYNPNLHGKYLIKSVTHHFDVNNKPFYKQKLCLIKNAYSYDDINDDMLYKSPKQPNDKISNKGILQS